MKVIDQGFHKFEILGSLFWIRLLLLICEKMLIKFQFTLKPKQSVVTHAHFKINFYCRTRTWKLPYHSMTFSNCCKLLMNEKINIALEGAVTLGNLFRALVSQIIALLDQLHETVFSVLNTPRWRINNSLQRSCNQCEKYNLILLREMLAATKTLGDIFILGMLHNAIFLWDKLREKLPSPRATQGQIIGVGGRLYVSGSPRMSVTAPLPSYVQIEVLRHYKKACTYLSIAPLYLQLITRQ